jgi:hypothetical protein
MTETMTMSTEFAGVLSSFTELRQRSRGRMTTYEYLTYLKVHRGIDCFGMSKDELSKMVKVGYDRWLAEYERISQVTVAGYGNRSLCSGKQVFQRF